ncbi:MAG: class I SAM-dependent methyltransferase [Rhizobiales bacterium]|nr:class I SAM-dependent methyltransferase [Hyphomicrobiales bacterium]
MSVSSSVLKYRATAQRLFAEHDPTQAATTCVGGNFIALGELEVKLLQMLDFDMNMSIVDVGAGCGRLATALARHGFAGNYFGTDVCPELLNYARERLPERYKFELVDGFAIPERDSVADFVCFFSVFTHLLHEESFVYLKDALRVLKPGGQVIVSYLDFAVNAHWQIFEVTVATINETRADNVFMSRDLWNAWAEKLGLRITFWQDGGIPFIDIEQPIVFENGVTRTGSSGLGPIGQSVIALAKPFA